MPPTPALDRIEPTLERIMTTTRLGMPSREIARASESIPPNECTIPLLRLRERGFEHVNGTIAAEEDLDLLIRGGSREVLSRTPGDDRNLIVGNLFCRGLINDPGNLECIDFSEDGTRASVALRGPRADRRFPVRRPGRRDVRVAPGELVRLKEVFERCQNIFRQTGSTHAAALFTREGKLLAFGEDVGRHNAFDKAIGRTLLEGTLGRAAIAMLSSRIAVAMASKATRAGISILCGFSAATTSGVNHALEHDMTLVGRLKKGSFDVYANAWRLKGE